MNASPRATASGLVAVTTIDDDDRPLRVAFDEKRRVLAIGPEAGGSGYATAGLYLFPPQLLDAGSSALAEGLGALRERLARSVSLGVGLEAVDVGRAYDIDRPADIRAAEAVADGGSGS